MIFFLTLPLLPIIIDTVVHCIVITNNKKGQRKYVKDKKARRGKERKKKAKEKKESMHKYHSSHHPRRGHNKSLLGNHSYKIYIILVVVLLALFLIMFSLLLVNTNMNDETQTVKLTTTNRRQPRSSKRNEMYINQQKERAGKQEDEGEERGKEKGGVGVVKENAIPQQKQKRERPEEDDEEDETDEYNANNNENEDNYAQTGYSNYETCVKTFVPGKAIVIVGMPRSGSTLLFNIARLLVEFEDANTISGYEIPPEEVYYWLNNNITVVIKAHDSYKMYINQLKNPITSENGMLSVPQGIILADYVLYSKRDLTSAMCSLYRLGWVEEATAKRRCLNMVSMNKTINRKLKAQERRQEEHPKPKYFDPITFDEITQSRGTGGNNNGNGDDDAMKRLIRKVSHYLGICASAERVEWVEAAVNSLKAVALPAEDPRSAQNPRSLLHSKHTITSSKLNNVDGNVNWDCTPVYQWIQRPKTCRKVYLTENGLSYP